VRIISVLFLLFLVNCTHTKVKDTRPSETLAYDSISKNRVKAQALKKIQQNDVCFEITLRVKSKDASVSSPSNWTLAWEDQNSRYHLLTLKLRDPASLPRLSPKKEWVNVFRTCAFHARLKEVKSLILTPKELPFGKHESLRLEWE
jgi:hypothetical protein